MKHETILELIKPTPQIYSKKCKFLTKILSYTLSYTHYIIALLVWYMYDYFYAIASLLLAYIFIGIIRAKLRNSVIPLNQQEYHYSDEAIATWFMAYQICLEKELITDENNLLER